MMPVLGIQSYFKEAARVLGFTKPSTPREEAKL